MLDAWIYAIISVVVISLVSLVGVVTLLIKERYINRMLFILISFSAGALFGDAFIHLLPEIAEKAGFTLMVSSYILLGIVTFFVIEKIIHWHHCNREKAEAEHRRAFTANIIIADAVHNLVDGLVVAGSYLISIPIGIATTIAVILHEVPQELGDFAVLLHGGFSAKKALAFNFLSAVTAVAGAVIALLLASGIENFTLFLVPFTAGGFVYIAGSDLVPELKKETALKKSFLQIASLAFGILVMLALALV